MKNYSGPPKDFDQKALQTHVARAVNDIKHYTVLFILMEQTDGQPKRRVGSGIFVNTCGYDGILTAYHVAKPVLDNPEFGHRHQIYAHRDAGGFEVADLGSVNQVRVVRTATIMRLAATEFHARYTMMPSIIKLCDVLERKTEYNVEKFWKKHSGKVPKKIGEFLLNVLDANADMWLPQKPMILSSGQGTGENPQ